MGDYFHLVQSDKDLHKMHFSPHSWAVWAFIQPVYYQADKLALSERKISTYWQNPKTLQMLQSGEQGLVHGTGL